jgi:hypothetical protein
MAATSSGIDGELLEIAGPDVYSGKAEASCEADCEGCSLAWSPAS